MQLCRKLRSFPRRSQDSQGRTRTKALGLQLECSEHNAAVGACDGPQWPTAVGLLDPLDAVEPLVSSYNMASSACQDGRDIMEMDGDGLYPDYTLIIGIILWGRHIELNIAHDGNAETMRPANDEKQRDLEIWKR